MKAANFQLTPVDRNSLILLREQLLTVCPLRHRCCGYVDRQPGEGAGKAGKRGNSPKPDFPLTQTLLTARLGCVPRGGMLGMHAGVCRDWRGTQEGKSPASCVHSWRLSLGGAQSYSHHLSLSLSLSPPQPSCFMELRARASPAPLLPSGDAAGPGVERPSAAPQSLSAEVAAAAAPLCAPADYYGRVLLCAQ